VCGDSRRDEDEISPRADTEQCYLPGQSPSNEKQAAAIRGTRKRETRKSEGKAYFALSSFAFSCFYFLDLAATSYFDSPRAAGRRPRGSLHHELHQFSVRIKTWSMQSAGQMAVNKK